MGACGSTRARRRRRGYGSCARLHQPDRTTFLQSSNNLPYKRGGGNSLRMRIAQLAPPLERVPPPCYGGTERVIHTLTEELVRRGHDVTLFASGDSETSARLVPTFEQAVWHHRPQYQDV